MMKKVLLSVLLFVFCQGVFSQKETYYAEKFCFSRIKYNEIRDDVIDTKMRKCVVPITIDHGNNTMEVHSIKKDIYKMGRNTMNRDMDVYHISVFESTDLCGEKCKVSLYFNNKMGRISIISVNYNTRSWSYYISDPGWE